MSTLYYLQLIRLVVKLLDHASVISFTNDSRGKHDPYFENISATVVIRLYKGHVFKGRFEKLQRLWNPDEMINGFTATCAFTV